MHEVIMSSFAEAVKDLPQPMEFREVGFLLSIQYVVKLPFSAATTFVAAL